MKEGLNETILSAEQQEQKEKFVELLTIVTSLPDTFSDSNEAYEVANAINDLYDEFEEKGLKLKDYLLGRVLLNDSKDYDPNYPFDEDEKIEKFIRKLYKEQQEKIAA